MSVVLLYSCLLLVLSATRGQKVDVNHIRSFCCRMGSSEGRSNYGLDCSGSRHPLSNVTFSQEVKESCVQSFSRCCKNSAETQSCREGKKSATEQKCDSSQRINESRHAFETCCNVCLFSLQSSRVYHECAIMPERYSLSFDDCCDRASLQPTPASTCYSSSDCQCEPGFKFLDGKCIDVNECLDEDTKCAPNHRCDNRMGSFECVRETTCGTGYTYNSDTRKCEDVDECKAGDNPCGPLTVCNNTQGSFRCRMARKCPPGMILSRTGRCSFVNCSHGSMFNFETSRCEDVDECISSPCSPTETCVNTKSGYECHPDGINCPVGYVHDPRTSVCLDVDECATKTHDCKVGQICFNTKGSYECKCQAGYGLDSNRNCEDIDECTIHGSGALCPSSSECVNTPGSFRCHCKPGFRYNISNPVLCDDIDECETHDHGCQDICFNGVGSFECRCRPGFVLAVDGKTCSDINECVIAEESQRMKKRDARLCQGVCENTVGSYRCSCPSGYVVSPHDQRLCQDIDECHPNGNLCKDDGGVCLNTRGAYRCFNVTCPPGYQKDQESKRYLQDINWL